MNKVINDIRKTLKENSDPHTLETGERFFKEQVVTYGVKTAIVDKIGGAYKQQMLELDKSEVFDLCSELWRSGYIEESFIACQWSYLICKKYEPSDFFVFNKWIHEYVSNWASCDTLCNHTVGTFVEMYPSYLAELKKWATSDNRWVKRAAAVTLIIPARHGKFLKDIFEIADTLLHDPDDLVQKGYGWMLKAASQAHEREVFEYVMKHRGDMPRTALRYAIEKMSKEIKAEAMKKVFT